MTPMTWSYHVIAVVFCWFFLSTHASCFVLLALETLMTWVNKLHVLQFQQPSYLTSVIPRYVPTRELSIYMHGVCNGVLSDVRVVV